MKINTFSLLLIITTVLTVLVLPVKPAQASGTSGWLVPFAASLDLPNPCLATESGVVISLVERDTELPVGGVVERWRVQVRDESGQVVGGQTVLSNNTSGVVCFDPNLNGIQVVVFPSPINDYKPITTPTMYVSPDLDSMIGQIFQGRVHLRPTSLPGDDFSIAPSGVSASPQVPDLTIQTDTVPAMYGVTAVEEVKLYLLNQSNSSRTIFNVPTTGAAGYRTISGVPDTLGEGIHLWTYNQSFNGTNFVNSIDTLLNWNFTTIPVTGAAPLASFVLDSTSPTSVQVNRVSVVSHYDESSMVINVEVQAADSLSGLKHTYLNILDSGGELLTVVPVTHTVSAMSSISPVGLVQTNFQIALPHSQNYTFFTEVFDEAGNRAVSNILLASVPQPAEISLPQLDNLSVSDIGTSRALLSANIINTGGAAVTRRGTCWSLVADTGAEETLPTFTTDPSRCIEDQNFNEGFSTGNFTHTHVGLPADTQIFYYSYLENMAGLTYSNLLSFETLPSAFAPGTDPVPPTLSLINPQLLYSDSAVIAGRISSIGGDPINLRAVCWSLSPLGALPPPQPSFGGDTSYCTGEVFLCPDGTFVAPNSNCEFICPNGSTPESFSIMSGDLQGMSGDELIGDESDTCLGVVPTCPDGSVGSLDSSCNVVCDAEEPTCPFLVRCGEGFITIFNEDGCPAYCELDAPGASCNGDAFMCPDGTIVERTGPSCEFSCPATGGGPTCQNWPDALPADATLPFEFSYRFSGLPSNTLIYYRVHAGNSYGVTSVDGTFTTAPLIYDFATVGSFEVTPTFNDESETFDVVVPVSALDLTNQITGVRRTIRYRVELLDTSSVVVDTVTGMVPTVLPGAPFIVRNAVFSNIPRGIWIFRVTVNTEPEMYSESNDQLVNNTVSSLVYLVNPNAVGDIITGISGGSGPTLPDPGIQIAQPNIIIRSGGQTMISWDVIETYPMDCRIDGPPTFGINGIYTFNPAIDGPQGSISTGPLQNAQIFRLTCLEPVTNSIFSTSTRVNVTGSIREL